MSAFDLFANEPRCIAWRNEKRRGKLTKVPYGANGKPAKANDPATWLTRGQALALAERIANGLGGGIGLELGNLGGDLYIVGFDLDSCIDENRCLTLWAKKILTELDTYAETSPSGTGVKAFFYIPAEHVRPFLELIGVNPDQWGTRRSVGEDNRDHGPAVELYCALRYFAVTDQLWPGKPARIATLDWEQLQRLAAVIPKPQSNRKDKHNNAGGRDNSRSAKAFREGARLRREGKSFDEMVEALRNHTDPDIAAWCREKGDERQMRRIWDKVDPDEEAGGATSRDEEHWQVDKNTKIIANSQHNIRLALRKLGVSLHYDKFANHTLVAAGNDSGKFDDPMVERLWLTIDKKFHFRPSLDFFRIVLRDTARYNEFHPVLDLLDSFPWDRTERMDNWLFTYGNVPKGDDNYNRYIRAVGRLVLVAAVRRLRQPGCKFDEMMVFVSETQGTDKSGALSILALRPEWFTDSINLGAKDKEAIEQLQGKWIGEIPEMRGRRKNDVDSIKAFLSRTTDRARLSYDHLPSEVPRQSVFFGSTNDVKFLRDRSGNRRFWPIINVKFDLDALTRDITQLWAEAVAAEKTGESIRLVPNLWAVAETVQNESLEEEPWVEVLATALEGLQGKIRAGDVWLILDIDVARRTPDADNRMGSAMRELKWTRKQRRYDGEREWSYIKGPDEQQITASRDLELGTLRISQGENMWTIGRGETFRKKL